MLIARRGHKPDVLMFGTSEATPGGIASVVAGLRGSELFKRCTVKYVTTHKEAGSGSKLIAAAVGLMRIWFDVATLRPKILHAHLSYRASFWRKALIIAPLIPFGVKYIIHLHGSEFRKFYDDECGLIKKLIVSLVFRRSSGVVALSPNWKAWISDRFPGAPVHCVPNSVFLQEHPARGHERPMLLFMGRLGERKGTYDLIRAFANLIPHPSSPRLILAGDGDISGVLALAHQLNVDHLVEAPGWVGAKTKHDLYRQASIFVLPSYNEGLPMSILEAMSYGLPVVSTPVGGIPDAIEEGVEGFLVVPGDVNALTDRLRRLVDLISLREHMGVAARNRVDREFSMTTVVDMWLRLYGDLGVPLRDKESLED